MKKLILLVLLLPCVLLNVWAQIPYSTKLDTNACNKRKAGKIKIVYTLRQDYDTVKGVLPKKARVDTVSYSRYDENGRVTEFCISPGDNSQYHTWYFYDGEGRLVRRLSCHPDSSSGFIEKYEYNNSWQVVRSTVYSRTENKDEILNVSLFFYDEKGLLASEEVYRDSSHVSTRLYDKRKIFFYDTKQRETVMVTVNGDGDTTYIDSTIYSSNGNYSHRGYHIEPIIIGNTKTTWRRLISSSRSKRDTTSGHIIMVHELLYYAGLNHVVGIKSWDSTITSMKGEVLWVHSDYSNYQSTQYFYRKSGKMDYAIIYNRNNKPIQRERKHIVYYD